MKDFYPAIEPYDKGHFSVSDLHTLYYEQVGNPNGVPIVFLHGGPGGGVSPDHRRFFDPSHYRIILFDQRGAGKSRPSAELRENTTWDLVNDIEKLREKFKIEKWFVFGGSWGSTLALTYAISHPERVHGLILRGIFLCRPWELSWFYQEGTSSLFPDLWEKYLAAIPKEEHKDLITAYHKRLTSENYETRLKAAKAWSQWEAGTSRLIIKPEAIDEFEDPEYALSFARIEAHYFVNNAFFSSHNWILENISKITHLPCTIVQGRYDVVCPAKSAWDLHKAYPKAEINLIPDAGHAASEPGIRSALIETTDRYRELISPGK